MATTIVDEWTLPLLMESFMGIKFIGTGPHGRVYTAYDRRIDNSVAIKRLEVSTPAQGERLKREVAAIKKARHRNIVPIFYALVRPKIALLVTAPKPANLHSILPLRYEMRVKISTFYCLTIQMLSALTYLQEEGMSHGNVKPTNILVETSGPSFHFQLTDFELSHPATKSDIPNNSFIYKAPETYTDTYPLTVKKDVWSLFVTLAIACGCLSEAELSRRGPASVAWAIVEAGVQMSELEPMAQQNPTLRASASVMFHQLRPKERVGSRGEIGYPEVSPEFVGLYGSGRLEKDAIPFGPRADMRSLTGLLGVEMGLGLGLPSLTAAVPEHVPEQYQFLPSGLGLFDVPTSATIEVPNQGMPPSSHNGQLQPQSDYEQYQLELNQYDPIDQRCLASCCNSNIPRSSSWTSPSQPLSPHAPSFVPVSPPLAPTTPQPLRELTPTEAWDRWGVYKVETTLTVTEYLRPYPMACDSQDDQYMDDGDFEDYEWEDDEDGDFVPRFPWQLPPLSLLL
ncbi:uncharacterized protein TRIVIDRAFT_62286 [Trichoderma virens Gv29-8]|uniref:Protein kinase domain-containing protein n=1 Tax=Hypocrea virens (strain Gv29-8 / FGSC 10586) TaxID=413071 RepID=G9MJF4_HYPVG|nr:uncharacterized protein TRIVIDRAFT_62286 [Trichoderma virens Gv29-8]EHK25617.1 hypothetical protein TRIVIDRAFT_62286 [Trichoderma virens Gv29-8]UKZ48565.1 hypothetical protein TrVGV298_002790 [Trichoderma virens]